MFLNCASVVQKRCEILPPTNYPTHNMSIPTNPYTRYCHVNGWSTIFIPSLIFSMHEGETHPIYVKNTSFKWCSSDFNCSYTKSYIFFLIIKCDHLCWKDALSDYHNRLLFLCYFKNGNIKTSNQYLASSVRQKFKKDIFIRI